MYASAPFARWQHPTMGWDFTIANVDRVWNDARMLFIANLQCSTQCHNVTTMQCKFVLHGCVVLHACIHAPMVRLQPKPKIVALRTAARNTANQPSICRLNYPHRWKTLGIATSDVNPFKIHCNLQITKVTVNITQWWHVINDVTNDVKLTSAIGVVLK